MPQLQDGTYQQKAVALYDNNAESSEELSFRSGDILHVLAVDYSGLQGWWLCSLRGSKGICPGNRLRLLNDPDLSSNDAIKRSCSQPKNPVVETEQYLYDEPKNSAPIQYDVAPSNPLPVEEQERYDIPRSLGGPSVCCSPLPDIQPQEYDIPKPAHPVSTHQEEYSVPGEVELAQGIQWLDRLEEEADGAIRGVLACAVSNWRKADIMRPSEVKHAVHRVRHALRELALFARSVAVSCRHQPTSARLAPLVEAVSSADSKVENNCADLDAGSWSIELLCQVDGRNPVPDPLGCIVSTVATAQHDVSALASFIQGNATLLFKKAEDAGKGDDYDFISNDGKDTTDSAKSAMDPKDAKILKFYGGQYGWEMNELAVGVTRFLESVERNQPPRVFLDHVKSILLAGGKLLGLVDAACRGLASKQLSETLAVASDGLARALNQAWRSTSQAALHFPNISNVQKMVNCVYTVSDHARQTRHALRGN